MKRSIVFAFLGAGLAALAVSATAGAARKTAAPLKTITILVKSDDEHAKKGPDGKWHDAFLPAYPKVTVGRPTKLVFVNYDSGAHSLIAPGLGLNVQIPAAHGSAPGRVSVAIVLPQPQLPQSVHDVTVDDTMSHPVDVQHSWTYPGLGCGAMIRPQFSESVLYSQAQNLAFAQVKTNTKVTGPLIDAAEAQAALIIKNNFIQPTVNALGYTLADFAIHWSAGPWKAAG